MIVCNEECAGGGVEVKSIRNMLSKDMKPMTHLQTELVTNACPKHAAPINNGK